MSLQAELSRNVECSSIHIGRSGASIGRKAVQQFSRCFWRFVAAMEESKRREGARLIRRYSHLVVSDD
jgi:hypothetical protein